MWTRPLRLSPSTRGEEGASLETIDQSKPFTRLAGVRALRQHVHPFCLGPGEPDDFQDLFKLGESLGAARVVGLGEATHGTHEFFVAKNRLIRFLVQKLGFSVVAFEANFAEAFAVNNTTLLKGHPHRGIDEVRAATYHLGYCIWFTEEIADLLSWICKHNRLSTPKVLFAGMDLTNVSRSAAIVRDFLSSASLKGCPELNPSILTDDATYETLNGLLRLMIQLKPRLIRFFTPREIAWVIQNLHQIIWARERERMSRMGSPIGRDCYMARNIHWLLDELPSQTKIAVWSHNWHVAKLFDRLGGRMAESLGREGYKSIGFATCAGEYRAIDDACRFRHHKLADPPNGSLEAWLNLAEVDSGYLLLDEPGLAILHKPVLARSQQIGYRAVAPEHQFAPELISSQYDVLIFFKQSSPSRLLNTRGGHWLHQSAGSKSSPSSPGTGLRVRRLPS